MNNHSEDLNPRHNVKEQTGEALSASPCCASGESADQIGLSDASNTIKRKGAIPFDFTKEEKEEVINYIRSLGPQYQNTTVILDKSDIPEDLLDQLSFADRDEDEVRNASRQLLDGMRRCKDRSRDSQSDSCS